MSIERRLLEVREKIKMTCDRIGRSYSEVGLVAVSKTKSVSEIREAYNCGQVIFAENYVQEIVPKIEQLESLPIHWHFVGPLQSNKVRKIIGRVDLIHSVDRLSVLKEIQRQSELAGVQQKILVQVNYAKEASKGGVLPEDAASFVAYASSLSSVRVCGLMTMPPFVKNPEENRFVFQGLKSLLIDLREQFFKDKSDQFCHLSMGTSQDFEVAIEEGATLIRVGTDIFGFREDAE